MNFNQFFLELIFFLLFFKTTKSLQFLINPGSTVEIDNLVGNSIAANTCTCAGTNFSSLKSDVNNHFANHPDGGSPNFYFKKMDISNGGSRLKYLSGPQVISTPPEWGVTGVYNITNRPAGLLHPLGKFINEYEFVLVGGFYIPGNALYEDVWMFDTQIGQWKHVKGRKLDYPEPVPGTQGQYSSGTYIGGFNRAVCLRYGDSEIYFIGGSATYHNSGSQNWYSNRIWAYNFVINEWKFVHGENVKYPTISWGTEYSSSNKRNGFSQSAGWVRGTELYTLGGYGHYKTSSTSVSFTDFLWVFDISRGTYGEYKMVKGTQDIANVAPDFTSPGTYNGDAGPGSFHTHAIVDISDDEVMIFGGKFGSTGKMSAETWYYSISLNMFKHVAGPANAGVAHIPVFGDGSFDAANRPGGLSQHGMMKFGDYVFISSGNGYYDGGGTSTGGLNDLWQFRLEDYQWRHVRGSQTIHPTPVFGDGTYSESNYQWGVREALILMAPSGHEIYTVAGDMPGVGQTMDVCATDVTGFGDTIITKTGLIVVSDTYVGDDGVVRSISACATSNGLMKDAMYTYDYFIVSIKVNGEIIGSSVETIRDGDIRTQCLKVNHMLNQNDEIDVVLRSEHEIIYLYTVFDLPRLDVV